MVQLPSLQELGLLTNVKPAELPTPDNNKSKANRFDEQVR